MKTPFLFALLLLFPVAAQAAATGSPLTDSLDPFRDRLSLYGPNDLSATSSQSWKFTVQMRSGIGSCTASYIGRGVLLTASHCVSGDEREIHLTQFWGSYIFQEDFMAVTAIRKHPGRDLALVLLSEDARPDESYTEVPLWDQYTPQLWQATLYVSGSGASNRDGYSYGAYLGFAQGRFAGRNWDLYSLALNRGQGVCAGDSGSPVMISRGGQLFLAGVTSASSSDLVPAHKCGRTLYFEPLDGEAVRWIRKNRS